MAGESVLTLISKVGSLFSIPIRFSDRLLVIGYSLLGSIAITVFGLAVVLTFTGILRKLLQTPDEPKEQPPASTL